jgi:hypothetical protein
MDASLLPCATLTTSVASKSDEVDVKMDDVDVLALVVAGDVRPPLPWRAESSVAAVAKLGKRVAVAAATAAAVTSLMVAEVMEAMEDRSPDVIMGVVREGGRPGVRVRHELEEVRALLSFPPSLGGDPGSSLMGLPPPSGSSFMAADREGDAFLNELRAA